MNKSPHLRVKYTAWHFKSANIAYTQILFRVNSTTKEGKQHHGYESPCCTSYPIQRTLTGTHQLIHLNPKWSTSSRRYLELSLLQYVSYRSTWTASEMFTNGARTFLLANKSYPIFEWMHLFRFSSTTMLTTTDSISLWVKNHSNWSTVRGPLNLFASVSSEPLFECRSVLLER